jgi:hypothetical protein
VEYLLVKKIDLLRAAMDSNDWKKALSIAAKIPRLGAHKDPIIMGHEAYTNPRFYAQIGKDPDVLINEGISALKERYS